MLDQPAVSCTSSGSGREPKCRDLGRVNGLPDVFLDGIILPMVGIAHPACLEAEAWRRAAFPHDPLIVWLAGCRSC